MKIEYETEVGKCYFTIKCMPQTDIRQSGLSHSFKIEPKTEYTYGTDSFGNLQIYGCEPKPHKEFVFATSGIVETNMGVITERVDDRRLGMYKVPHGKCVPGEKIRALFDAIKENEEYIRLTDDEERSRFVMHMVKNAMNYTSGSTEFETTAEDALLRGEGVCQDYAHIMISVLRLLNIPARYVCGFVVGEGESHAWVEAAVKGKWIAMDPTYDRMITEEYIKIGVGRDAADCSINRGVMWGGGQQTQTVTVAVSHFMMPGEKERE